MPLTRTQRARYPADWRAIRARVLAAASHRCEYCGVADHVYRIRERDGCTWTTRDGAEAEAAYLVDEARVTRIVLTVHHVDANPANSNPANLRALCQRCHLAADRHRHRAHASHTRAERRAGPTQPLPGME